jgi:hypothetical protein
MANCGGVGDDDDIDNNNDDEDLERFVDMLSLHIYVEVCITRNVRRCM